MLIHSWSRLVYSIAALLAVTATGSTVHAQSSSMFGGSGPMNSSSGLGTGTSGGMASTGLGGTGMGGMGLGGMGMGTTGGGAMGSPVNGSGLGGQGGAGGAGGVPGQGGQRTAPVGQGNNRFVGQTQFNQQNQSMNQQGQNRAANTRGRAGQNQNQAMNPFGSGAGGAPQRVIRPQHKVAFEYSRPTTEKLTTNITVRFSKLSSRAAFKGVSMETDGTVVTLRGEVDKSETRRLAGMLAAIEPGVRKVKNELTVKEQPAPVAE